MEIAWLMLKGYSFKEIAALREVKEKTIRQQASSIYSKSGSNNQFIVSLAVITGASLIRFSLKI